MAPLTLMSLRATLIAGLRVTRTATVATTSKRRHAAEAAAGMPSGGVSVGPLWPTGFL